MRLLLALLLMPIGCACCTWAIVPWAAFENLPMTPTVVTLPTTVPAGKEAPPTPTAGNGVAVPEEVPPPSLFSVAWDQRAVFEAELIAAEEDALRLRPGASVYHLDLNLADDLTRLTGRQEVHYTNTESVPLTEVYFRLFPNIAGGETNVTAVTLNGAPVQPRYALENSALIVPLGRALAPGESVVIGLDYTVTVPTWPGGNYGTFALLDEVLALAHFYPLIPAYDDEGWNAEMAPSIGDVVYADTSYYWVRLEAPAALVVVTSGRELERVEQGDRRVYTFIAGPVRDFYLVASPRFAVSSTTVGETDVHSWAFPERTEAATLALEQAATALAIYNRRFGPYPYTELDIVATPTLAGGVEYPGVIVVAASVYENPSDPFFEHVVAHEVAHQWFYGVVGNDQVDEPWLDESL
ncbi:MAG: M1 family metallopeptidase, partial [Anaerolineae bacterium]|nr:M1 family metallopeptidase [Anaerolineae bacterium]